MKNMFRNSVINSIEQVETFKIKKLINKINISSHNYKSKNNKRNLLNINYDVDIPPIKEPLCDEEEI